MEQENTGKNEKRIIIQIRVTEDEKKEFIETANNAGMNITDLIKFRTINKRPQRVLANRIQKSLIKIMAELGMVRSNIEQIAKAIHDKINYSIDLKNTIAKTSKDLRDLYDDIMQAMDRDRTCKNFKEEYLADLFTSLRDNGNNCNQIAKMINTEERVYYKVTIRESVVRDVITKTSDVMSAISKYVTHGDKGQITG